MKRRQGESREFEVEKPAARTVWRTVLRRWRYLAVVGLLTWFGFQWFNGWEAATWELWLLVGLVVLLSLLAVVPDGVAAREWEEYRVAVDPHSVRTYRGFVETSRIPLDEVERLLEYPDRLEIRGQGGSPRVVVPRAVGGYEECRELIARGRRPEVRILRLEDPRTIATGSWAGALMLFLATDDLGARGLFDPPSLAAWSVAVSVVGLLAAYALLLVARRRAPRHARPHIAEIVLLGAVLAVLAIPTLHSLLALDERTRAVRALTANRPVEAAERLHHVVERDPQDVAAWYALGCAELRTGEWAASLAAFDRVLELEPGHAGASMGRAHSLLSAGESRRALPLLLTLAGELPEGPWPGRLRRLLPGVSLLAALSPRSDCFGSVLEAHDILLPLHHARTTIAHDLLVATRDSEDRRTHVTSCASLALLASPRFPAPGVCARALERFPGDPELVAGLTVARRRGRHTPRDPAARRALARAYTRLGAALERDDPLGLADVASERAATLAGASRLTAFRGLAPSVSDPG